MKKILLVMLLTVTAVLTVFNPICFTYQQCKIVIKPKKEYQTYILSDYESVADKEYRIEVDQFGIRSDRFARNTLYENYGIFSVPVNAGISPFVNEDLKPISKEFSLENISDTKEYMSAFELGNITDKASMSSKNNLLYGSSFTGKFYSYAKVYNDRVFYISYAFEKENGKYTCNGSELIIDGKVFDSTLTEESARSIMEKVIYTETDNISEYRSETIESECGYYIDGNESYGKSYIYRFRKYVDGNPTYETVTVQFRNLLNYGTLGVYSTESAPITSEDIIELNDEKITRNIEELVNIAYNSGDKSHGNLTSIEIAERYLAKSLAGQRSVICNVKAEFEDGESALIETVTFLEDAYVYDNYPLVAFIFTQIVLVVFSAGCMFFMKNSGKRKS